MRKKVEVAVLRMLMCGNTRKYKIQNYCTRSNISMAPIEAKTTQNKLSWFGHVQRKLLEALVRRVDYMVFSPVKRGRGRPKRTIRNY